ncbi:MAG: hypothetical protein ACI9EF_003037, partial [Pseudohongiellaceae bacterium]
GPNDFVHVGGFQGAQRGILPIAGCPGHEGF